MSNENELNGITDQEIADVDNDVLRDVIAGIQERPDQTNLTWGRVAGFADWGRKKP